jgi:hypothetical protein
MLGGHMPRRFDDLRTQPARALQIWQILISKAHNRQTMTYGQLADLMNFEGAGVFAPILDVLLKYCR